MVEFVIMASPKMIGPTTEALPEILEIAYRYMQEVSEIPFTEASKNLDFALKTDQVGVMGVCIEASSAVTRAAQELGITATREVHENHNLTSFAPLDAYPSEDDLILCLTWGQFDPFRYKQKGLPFAQQPYFGPRRGVYDLGVRRDAFAANTITHRQPVHCRWPFSPVWLWLLTTPQEVVTGAYPAGEVSYGAYPGDRWIF